MFFEEEVFWQPESMVFTDHFGPISNESNRPLSIYAIDKVRLVSQDDPDGCSVEKDIVSLEDRDSILVESFGFANNSNETELDITPVIKRVNNAKGNWKVLVAGYASEKGEENFNLQLSKERANYVALNIHRFLYHPVEVKFFGETHLSSGEMDGRRVDVYLIRDN